jgi:hypothetical protein
MADRLRVTELDFDTIKNNLKAFLKQQNEFTDYDFEGSGLSVLLDILAYNTHYNAYYLNMVANESFLDTALLRNSVVSHAKSLGYTPYSTKSPVSTINFEVKSNNPNNATLTLTKGFSFLSNQIDGKSYNFVVLDDVTSTKANSSYLFENLEIHEGQLVNYRFVYDEQSNPKQIFTIPEDNIDTSTLKVTVFENSTTTEFSVYEKVKEILDVTSSSEVYFLQESRTGKYQIYFGDDVIGKKLPAGAVIILSYLVTNGTQANKANNFVSTSVVVDSLSESLSNFIITPVSEASGGSNRESVESVRSSSIKQYLSQNRLVTYKDYESFILNNYPNIDSISVWGGEEEIPPVFGKVFVSLKPKNNYFLSEAEKQRIVDEIIKPKSIVSIDTLIKDPEFLYVKITNTVTYNENKTTYTPEIFKNLIRTTILNFFDVNVNKFNSTFALSKLEEEIDNLSNDSILGIQSSIRLEKRFKPELSVRNSYKINFNAELFRGNIIDRLVSDEFKTFDVDNRTIRRAQIEEVFEAFTGIAEILITNPGSGYTSIPEVTITGDGTGATARAKIVNGRVQSIVITNRGVNYTRAIITVSGGGGFGCKASVILNTRFGVLRTVYFDENSERKVINPIAGTINYDTGEVILDNLNILATYSDDGFLRINAKSQNDVISSDKNTIITIDNIDPTSIVTTLLTR